MNIIKLPVGYLQANCYILNKENTNIIIDPGDEVNKIKQNINGEVLCILITHRHFDHIGALDELQKHYKCKVYDFSNTNEKEYKEGKFIFEVIHTKGHTSDSVTYYFKNDKSMFTGDFLFKETIGRTDLETGNMSEMLNSLKKIIKYEDINIYPGHGESTSIEYEKKHNPFIINI